MSSVRNRVTAGAAHLDSLDPEWFRKIDLGNFDIGNGVKCILGQLRGSWGSGLTWAYPNANDHGSRDAHAAKHGFIVTTDSFAHEDGVIDEEAHKAVMRKTERAWRYVIEERLGNTPDEPADIQVPTLEQTQTYNAWLVTYEDGSDKLVIGRAQAGGLVSTTGVVKAERVRVAVLT